MTRDLVVRLRDRFGYDEPGLRDHIVQAVRIAIGEETQPSLESVAESEAGDGDATIIAITAGVYREALRRCGLDRDDPVVAESFMAEVIAILDDELPAD